MLLVIAAALLVGGCKKDPGKDDSGTPGGKPPIEGLAELVEGGVVDCPNPEARDLAPYQRHTSPSPTSDLAWIYAGGAISADLDGDRRYDVVAPNLQAQADVYLSTGGSLFAERDDVLEAFDLSYGTGGTAVDYDGDGDTDLYITRYGEPNRLLRNEGGLVFTDVTDQAGVSACDPDGTCYRSLSSSWADFDRDGDLDLVVGNYGYVPHDGTLAADLPPAEPSFLYANNGDGTFTDATAQQFPRETMGRVHNGYTYIASFLDLDRDGWPELYFINDFGAAFPNTLLWNREGQLAPDANAHGLDVDMTGMCLGVTDFNEDSFPDLFMSEWNRLTFLQSAPEYGGIYVSLQTPSMGLAPASPQKVPWGCEFTDLDLDGDEDLSVAYGYVRNDGTAAWSNPLMQPDAIYLRGDNGVFLDLAPTWGMGDTGVGRGSVVADFNDDGHPDLFKRDPKGPDVYYFSQCGAGNWLTVALEQPGTLNTQAVGAVVEIEIAGKTQTRWVMAGGRNFASAPPLEVSFGLGSAVEADELRVFWPDGELSRFSGVAGRQRVEVLRR